MSKTGQNIYKRKDGRWEGRYTKGRDGSGKRRIGYVYGKTYREVLQKRKEAELQAEVKQDCTKIQISELAQQWIARKKHLVKSGTLDKYQRLLDTHILPRLGPCMVEHVSAAVLQNFQEELLETGRLDGTGGLSVKSTKDIYYVVLELLEFARQYYDISVTVPKPDFPALERREQRIFSFGDEKKLIHAILTAYEEDLRCLGLLLCMYTGLRIGEVCALRWGDFHFDTGIVKISNTLQRVQDTENVLKEHSLQKSPKTKLILERAKTQNSVREIPLHPDILPIMEKKGRGYGTYCFFLTGEEKKCVEPRNYQYYFKKFQEKNQIIPINFHGLRHNFASRCIRAGMDVKSLSEILGHSSTNFTLNCYVHSSLEQKKNQLKLLKYETTA